MPAERCPHVLRFFALRRTVLDLRRALAFYCDGLGFRRIADEPAVPGEATIQLGDERIVLIEGGAAMARPPLVGGPDVRFQHVAIVARDMDAAFAQLQEQAPVAISNGGPQRLPAASGGACAFKFRDPDGHPLELIEFAAGQGAARWHAAARSGGLTLGIDHAAISVSAVDDSIAFYGRLGFRLASRQLNRGPEQARLDGLDGLAAVQVEVVALVPASALGAHLELLGYINPEAMRGPSVVHQAADRLVWQARQTSSEPAAMIRDPDGHLNVISR